MAAKCTKKITCVVIKQNYPPAYLTVKIHFYLRNIFPKVLEMRNLICFSGILL